jgi:hypothetical protein
VDCLAAWRVLDLVEDLLEVEAVTRGELRGDTAGRSQR